MARPSLPEHAGVRIRRQARSRPRCQRARFRGRNTARRRGDRYTGSACARRRRWVLPVQLGLAFAVVFVDAGLCEAVTWQAKRPAQTRRVDAELGGEVVQRIAALEVSGSQQVPQVAGARIDEAKPVLFYESPRRRSDNTGSMGELALASNIAFDKIVIRHGFVDEALLRRVRSLRSDPAWRGRAGDADRGPCCHPRAACTDAGVHSPLRSDAFAGRCRHRSFSPECNAVAGVEFWARHPKMRRKWKLRHEGGAIARVVAVSRRLPARCPFGP